RNLHRAHEAIRARREDAALRGRPRPRRRRRFISLLWVHIVGGGGGTAAGRPVAELSLCDRPSLARRRPAHGARRHRPGAAPVLEDRKSTRLNSSHEWISYAVFCLKKKKKNRFENLYISIYQLN